MYRLTKVLSLGILVAALVGGPASAATNLLLNPGFEMGGGSYMNWFTFGSGPNIETPADDNIIRTGSAAAKIFGEFTNCPAINFDVGGFGQVYTSPTAGMEYEFSGYSYVWSGDPIPGTSTCDGNRAIAQLAFFDALSGGAVIQRNEIVIGDWDFALDAWVPFSVKGICPAGALRLEVLVLFLQPGCDAGSVYIDDTALCEASPMAMANQLVNPSFDANPGFLDGWGVFGNTLYGGDVGFQNTAGGAAKMFGTFVGGADSGLFQRLAATPGENYELSAYGLVSCENVNDRIESGNPSYTQLSIVFRDSGGNEIGGSSTILSDASSPEGHWDLRSVSSTAPAGTDSVDAVVLFVQPDTTQGGAGWVDDITFKVATASGVNPATVGNTQLKQNYPNPFNPTTSIRFDLLSADEVSLTIYDAKGRTVAKVLQAKRLGAGPHTVKWDGITASGRQAASGVYYYVLRTSLGQESRSMVLLK